METLFPGCERCVCSCHQPRRRGSKLTSCGHPSALSSVRSHFMATETKVIPVTAMVLRPHFNDMEYKLRPGMITLTWTSMNIDTYKGQVMLLNALCFSIRLWQASKRLFCHLCMHLLSLDQASFSNSGRPSLHFSHLYIETAATGKCFFGKFGLRVVFLHAQTRSDFTCNCRKAARQTGIEIFCTQRCSTADVVVLFAPFPCVHSMLGAPRASKAGRVGVQHQRYCREQVGRSRSDPYRETVDVSFNWSSSM